ncbi:site-specific integrase, partial [Rickettsia sp. wb]
MEFISQFLEMLLAERALSKNSILSYKGTVKLSKLVSQSTIFLDFR